MGNVSLPVDSRPSVSRVRWTMVGPVLFIATAVAMIDKISIAVVIANSFFLKDMGLTGHPVLIGALVTAFLVSYGAGLFIWGFLIDLLGPRRAAITGVLLWSLMLLLSGLATSLGVMFASRVGLGLTEGILFPVCNAFVARWFPWEERGRAQSFWFNGATVGAALGGLVATALIISSGWRTMFFVLAVLGLVLVVPMLIWFTSDSPQGDRRVSAEELRRIDNGATAPQAREIGLVLRDYRYWLLVLSFTLNNVFFWGWQSWMPTYLIKARHFSFASAGWVTALMFALEVVAVIAMAAITDRNGGKRALWGAVGFWLAAVGLFIGGHVPAVGLGVAIIIVGLCGQQASAGNAQALIHSFSQAGSMGKAAGIMNAVANLASAFAPALIGAMIGLHSSFNGVLTFLVIVLLAAGLSTAAMARSGY